MLIQCPDCGLKLKPKPPASTPEGSKVQVTCRCGAKLRFTMPGKPKAQPTSDPFPRASIEDLMRSAWGR